MKSIATSSVLTSAFSYKATIIVSVILFSTLGTSAALRCESLFLAGDLNKQNKIDSIKSTYQAIQKSNVEWSESSEIFVYTEGQNRFAVSVKSKVKVKIDNSRPIFSNDGDSVSVFSKNLKMLLTYKSPTMKPQYLEIDADHIVDVRGQHVIAQRKNKNEYFIFSLQTGELLHHIESASSYIKLKNSADVAFLSEPSIRGMSLNKVVVEKILLSTLTVDHKDIRTSKFDERDNSFNSDQFIKIKSGSQDLLLRRSDLSQYEIGYDFVRAYEIDSAKNLFAIQTKDQITVYKNGQLDFEYSAGNVLDTKIVAYSQAEISYIAYDSKNKKLFSIVSIWNKSIHKLLEQKVDDTFFMPKMIGPTTILFQGTDHKYYAWSLRQVEAVPMRDYMAEGISVNSKYLALPVYDKNNSEWTWEFKEIYYRL